MATLTKRDRERIIRSIMADIPSEDHRGEIQKRALEIAVSRLPEKVRAVWDDEKIRGYLNNTYVSLRYFGTVTVPTDARLEWDVTPRAAFGDEGLAELSRMVEASNEEKKKRDALHDRLTVEIGAVRTDKQFRERLPDLVKYLPENVVVKNLPATTDLMDTLKAAGFNPEAEA
jgi:hypothetical protein